MIIDGLQRLSAAGFQIADYQYTGFGSIYFVDFTLFHKFLGFKNMLSLEHDTNLESRVRFNRPYKFVDVEMQSATWIIPTLNRDRKHLLWLDYDGVLKKDHISDVLAAMTYLSVGSIVLVTLDGEPPELSKEELDRAKRNWPRAWMTYFEAQAGEFLDSRLAVRDFAKSNLPTVNVKVMESAFAYGLAGRTDVEFSPLFNFIYRDGSNQMLTIGGMVTSAEERRRIASCNWVGASYYRSTLGSEPYRIVIPRLTRKERLFLDHAMPCPQGWRPTEVDIPQELIDQYREIYRFFPAFAELML